MSPNSKISGSFLNFLQPADVILRAEMAEKRMKNERIEELEKLLAEKEQQITELGASQPEPVPEAQKVELTEEEITGMIL